MPQVTKEMKLESQKQSLQLLKCSSWAVVNSCGMLTEMEQMLLAWHASAERMLQAGCFDESLEECLTSCVLKYHCFVFS